MVIGAIHPGTFSFSTETLWVFASTLMTRPLKACGVPFDCDARDGCSAAPAVNETEAARASVMLQTSADIERNMTTTVTYLWTGGLSVTSDRRSKVHDSGIEAGL